MGRTKPALQKPRLVVDVCLAVWACHTHGDTVLDATYRPWEIADLCLGILCRLRGKGYNLAMSKNLRGEWEDQLRHQGDRTAIEYACRQYARDWYMSLETRGRIARIDVAGYQLMGNHLTKAQRKDAHLVESALAADYRILSRDTAVRREWETTCQMVPNPVVMSEQPSIRRIFWGDPAIHGDRLLEWLDQGAPRDDSLLLTCHGRAGTTQ